MDVLNVGTVSKTYFYVPYWAAQKRGFFAAAGLEVHTAMLGNASQIEPLESGKLDVVIGAPEGVLQNAAAGGFSCRHCRHRMPASLPRCGRRGPGRLACDLVTPSAHPRGGPAS